MGGIESALLYLYFEFARPIIIFRNADNAGNAGKPVNVNAS